MFSIPYLEIVRKRWLEKNWGNNATITLNVLYAKKEKYTQLMFKIITQIVKNKLFF